MIIHGTAPIHRKNAFACYPGPVRVDVLPAIEPPARVAPAELLDRVAELKARAEALYRAVPDLNRADGELPEPALVQSPSESPS